MVLRLTSASTTPPPKTKWASARRRGTKRWPKLCNLVVCQDVSRRPDLSWCLRIVLWRSSPKTTFFSVTHSKRTTQSAPNVWCSGQRKTCGQMTRRVWCYGATGYNRTTARFLSLTAVRASLAHSIQSKFFECTTTRKTSPLATVLITSPQQTTPNLSVC